MTAPPRTRFGVDAVGFRTLYGAFRLLSRRGSSVLLGDRASGRATSMTSVYVSALLFGLFAAMPLVLLPPRAGSLLFATIVLLWANFAVVADFATVVLAPEDDDVIFPLPVTSRTYLAARLAVAARHVTVLSLCLGACGVLATTVRSGSPLAGLGLLLTTVACALFALVLGFAVFRIALTLLGGERMRGLLAYGPGLLGMGLAFLPQFLPGMRTPGWVHHAEQLPAIWAFPPFWFAGLHDVALEPTALTAARAAVGLLAVPVGAWVLVTALGGGTLERLQALVASSPARRVRRERTPGPGAFARTVFGVRSAEARAGWLFARAAMRTRAFRARALPLLVAPVLWLLAVGTSGTGTPFAATMDTFLVFMLGATGSGVVALLPYADPPDGAWLYEAFPFRRYGRFHAGVLRAALATWALPEWLLFAGVSFGLVPTIARAASVVYGLGVSLSITALAASLDRHRPPFAERLRTGAASGRTRAALLTLGIAIGATLVHGIVIHLAPAGLPILAGGAVAIAVLTFAALRRSLDALPPPALAAVRV